MKQANLFTISFPIALSIVNMKLRDYYPSLHHLCDDLEINEADLIQYFRSNGYFYHEDINQFNEI